MKILLYGKSGIGKTTLLTKFIEKYKGETDGFTTRRMKDQNGLNWGFEVVTLQGEAKILAHKSQIDSPYIIGNGHHVDIGVIDRFMVPKIIHAIGPMKVLIVDEIGRMEALSPRFLETVSKVLSTSVSVLGTIVYEDEEWALPFKRNKECVLVEVTEQNRDQLLDLMIIIFDEDDNFERLTDVQKDVFRILLSDYFKTNSYIQIRKLYTNTLSYIIGNQVTKVGDGRYSVLGNHGDHQVYMDRVMIECDCDLFKGSGPYVGKAGECSHIQAVKIIQA